MKTAYIGMSADPPHEGHIRLVRRVEKLGFKPIIILNSDSFIKEYKHREPFVNLAERTLPFRRNGWNVWTVQKEEQREMIKSFLPDVIVVGTDWMKPEILPQLGIDEKFLEDNNIAMLFLSRTPGISSTQLRGKQ